MTTTKVISPSMISGEILMRTRRMGKRTTRRVTGTKLRRRVPKFRNQRDHDLGQRILRSVLGAHGHRALRAVPVLRDLDHAPGRIESLERREDQEVPQARLQVGPGPGAGSTRKSPRRAQGKGQGPDLGQGRRRGGDHPLVAGQGAARDGQGEPSHDPEDEMDAAGWMKPRALAPMQILVVFSFEINSPF